MLKKILIVCMSILVLLGHTIVFAEEYVEEELGQEEFEAAVQETLAEAPKIPTINSRYAVIYDRQTRQNIIWKKRK